MKARLPVVADVERLARRLAAEEDEARHELARLEDRLRTFADLERPAYASWVRLELGPACARLDERAAELRVREMMAARVDDLVEGGWPPREALYAAEHGVEGDDRDARGGMDPDEVDARRRAKRERKRAERKRVRREQRGAKAGGADPSDAAARARITELYRGLARRLHPDSPTALRTLEPARLRTIWGEVQAAYATRSLERMLAVSVWVESIATAGGGSGAPPVALLSLAERRERLRSARRSRAALERRLADLARDPAWGFADATPAARRRLKREAAQRLDAELADVDRALADVEEWLAAIGRARPPKRKKDRT